MLNGTVYSPEIILQSQPILATMCLNQYITKKELVQTRPLLQMHVRINIIEYVSSFFFFFKFSKAWATFFKSDFAVLPASAIMRRGLHHCSLQRVFNCVYFTKTLKLPGDKVQTQLCSFFFSLLSKEDKFIA